MDPIGAIGCISHGPERLDLFARLDWATEITETEFFQRVKQLPKAKSFPGFKK
jgi:hypothetical protein